MMLQDGASPWAHQEQGKGRLCRAEAESVTLRCQSDNQVSRFRLPLPAVTERELRLPCGWGSISTFLWFLRSRSGPVTYYVRGSNSSFACQQVWEHRTGSFACPKAGQLSLMEGEWLPPTTCNREVPRHRTCFLEPFVGPCGRAGGGHKNQTFSTGTAPWKEKSQPQDQPWGSGDEAQHKMQLLLLC